MNKLIAIGCLPMLLATTVMPDASIAAGATIPCEQMLNDLKAAIKTAKLTDADKAKVADLETKGTERCKADDDVRADAFFAQALRVLGK